MWTLGTYWFCLCAGQHFSACYYSTSPCSRPWAGSAVYLHLLCTAILCNISPRLTFISFISGLHRCSIAWYALSWTLHGIVASAFSQSFFPSVDLQVSFNRVWLSKPFTTNITLKRPFSCVDNFMSLAMRDHRERLGTVGTLVGPLPGVAS